MMEPEEDLTLVDRILCLPGEIREMVYSHLDNNEVIRSRAVNKQFKKWAAEQLVLSKRLPRNYVEISMKPDDPRSLDAFKNACQNLDLKILKIKIVQGGNFCDRKAIAMKMEFQSHPEMNWFLRECAPCVKYLSLETLTLPIGSKEEVKFLESFKDLESFSCDKLTWIKSKKGITVPCCFKNLKHLNVRMLVPSGMAATVASQRFCHWVTQIRATTTLEGFTCPDIKGPAVVAGITVQRDLVLEMIQDAMAISKPIRMDMNGFFTWAGRVIAPSLVENRAALLGRIVTPVIELCARAKVKFDHLDHVHDFILQMDMTRPLIKSMSLHCASSLFRYDYPNLEKVEVTIPSHVQMAVNVPVTSWPELRGAHLSLLGRRSSPIFCAHFFRTSERPNLRSLSLSFGDGLSGLLTETDICTTCPNLTYLNLHNFYGKDSSFLALWEGLPFLEYVSISGCPYITENGLIGHTQKQKNPMDRGIRALKKLKFLELMNLRGITDKLFITTLRHMNLKALRLVSGDEWKNDYDHLLGPHSDRFKGWRTLKRYAEIGYTEKVTMKGLRELKTGELAKTIEMLDLKYLKIPGVSQEQITEFQGEFRSANMIPV